MLLALLAASISAAAPVPTEIDPATLRSGDLVFHTSRTQQARAIVLATASPYAHVGLVERRGAEVHVLEAVQPVQRTPFAQWRRRGLGEHITVMRHEGLDDAARAAVVAAARSYLGRPYDLYFTPDDDRIYCSELIERAYASIGVRLGEPTPAAELGLHTPPVQALLRQRWRRHPSCAGAPSLAACMPTLARLEIVTPASLRRDPQLHMIASSYPAAVR
jgi:hypothetical protein